MYELNQPIKSLAVANDFVSTLNKVCYQLGKNLKPFCFYANDVDKRYNVVEFSEFQALLNPSLTLAQEVAEYRAKQYSESFIQVNPNDEVMSKLLLYDYLLSVSACYIEIPKFTTKKGYGHQSYDKFLATRNPAIMATWMGCTPQEMQVKYSARIPITKINMMNHEITFVKLNYSSKGTSISCPRGSCTVDEMRCTPLFMLYAFQKGFEPALKEGLLKFTYLKDNGTVREMCSTLSTDELMKYYTDTGYVGNLLSHSDYDKFELSGMKMSTYISRGYIKVPEAGSSVYDLGVRSLNLARILKVEKINTIDTTFINVDLSSCADSFKSGIDSILKASPDEIFALYTAATGKEPESDQAVLVGEDLKFFIDSGCAILSTTFLRDVPVFMTSNPLWFPLYTGRPIVSSKTSASFGVEEIDF